MQQQPQKMLQWLYISHQLYRNKDAQPSQKEAFQSPIDGYLVKVLQRLNIKGGGERVLKSVPLESA